MKFIHVADIHASRERLPQTLSILKTLTERAKQGDIEFIIFAGDFWDSTITATKGSGFSDIVSAVRRLEQNTKLLFIYGTPTHEPSGSLDAFKSDNVMVVNDMTSGALLWNNAEFICIPEPRRSDYVSDSIAATNDLINKRLQTFIEHRSIKPLVSRIVIYHGEVKGAVYQNGVSASSPTAISKELLQSLNADYYALGHIHLPQEVFKNAWYSGSACPKDFGETHDGCYNLVTIDNEGTKVEQVSFGLPIYQTYRVNYPFENPHGDWSNYHIRLQFDCTREERKALNLKQLSDNIKEDTHALSVKLEPSVIETEAASKSEVSKHKSIVEKMTEYAKEKGVKLPKYSKELLQEIQDNTLIKLSYPQHSFELLSLSLRGAIGIRDGQHKENYELNFEEMEDGVVCLVGHMGAGKSTILENCHPYPKMLTRNGTLKDHFYLRDSHRILIYKDENGLYYKISMLIDGKNQSGTVSYFVKTSENRNTWKPLPNVDGSLKSYEDWVNQTFGSIDIFLRTAFFAKEPTKEATDISSTTKGERMELLSKLAGTEHLKEVSRLARESRKALEKEIEKLDIEIESFSFYEDSIKVNEQSIEASSKEKDEQLKQVSNLESTVTELKTKDKEYQKVKATAEANARLCEKYNADLDNYQMNLQAYEDALKNFETIEELVVCQKTIKSNNDKISEKQKKVSALHSEIEEFQEDLAKEEIERNQNISKYNQIQAELKIVESQIVPVEEVCPTCGAPLSDKKVKELLSAVKENESKRDDLIKQLAKYNIDEDYWTSVINPIKSKIKEARTSVDLLIAGMESLKKENESCADFIQNNSGYQDFVGLSKEDIQNNVLTLKKDMTEAEAKIDELSRKQTVEDVSEELNKAEAELKQKQARIAELSATIKAAEKENEKYRKALESISDKKKELAVLKGKTLAYDFIEESFGNNGIPAIELRESAPEIADVANKILKDSYGNKFEIRFGSTSELKANRKSNEDFNILVYDTENGDEKTIDLVSSGERIWLKQALFYAFSIVQMNRTGFNFRTRLIDESDGSLDGGTRPKYLQMVTAAHAYSSSRITLMITHSQEIKDIAQQIIEI